MTEAEVIERAETLPDRFADRLTESTLWSIKRMRGGGEYGELTLELAAALAAHQTPVSPGERDELRELLEAMGMPTDPIEQLNVQA
jgi:hypothetical protein